MDDSNLSTRERPLPPHHGEYLLITFILLLVMLVLRLFNPYPVIAISHGDAAKYLGLAHDFPFHRLYNNELYLMHGPGYPALIRLGMLVMTDHVAATCVSIVMSVVAFWAIGRVCRILRIGRTGVLLARTFLVFQPLHLALAQEISKETGMIALYAMLLGGFMSSLRGGGRAGWLPAVAGGYLALTADQHILLVLISLAVVRLTWPQRSARLGIVPLIPMLLVWLGTVTARMIRFSTGPLIPIGMDGLPEDADRLGPLQAIIPNTAPQSSRMVDFNDFWSNLLNCGSFAHDFFLLLPLPYQVHLWHIALLLLVLLGVVRAIVFEGRRRRRFGLGMLLCAAVLFGVPMLTKPQERYAALALIPMAALVAMNGRWFVGRPMRGRPVWWPIAACIVLAGGLVFVARGGFRHDVLTRSLVVEAEVVAQWIERNPTRGIMAQIGYPPELAYLTDRRVLGLPGDPKLFEVALRHYDISHIVVGSAYHRRWDWPDRSEVWNAATIDYIRSRPEAFRRVALLHQPVDGGRNRDEFLILEVDTTWLHAPSESPSDRDDDGS